MRYIQENLDARVARARTTLGKGCRYKMGGGTNLATTEWPWRQTEMTSDCSNWLCWVVGMAKHQGAFDNKPWSGNPRYDWIGTDTMFFDATGPHEIFVEIPQIVAGCMLVFPPAHGRAGHCGLVAKVVNNRPIVIDCRSPMPGDEAIGESVLRFDVFRRHKAVPFVLVQDVKP